MDNICYICSGEGEYIFEIEKNDKRLVCQRCKKKYFKKLENNNENN